MKTISSEEWQDILILLSEPFDPALIKWKPQPGGIDYGSKKALATAHADPRAYIDRLNAVVGPDNWESHYTMLATPYNKLVKGRKAYKDKPATEDQQIAGDKLIMICELTLFTVTHSSTGDEDASDENVATSAEAQAFKRAATTYGLGKYLYRLPAVQVPYDPDTRKFIQTPVLPDWAIPQTRCEDCHKPVEAGSYNGLPIPIARLLENSQVKYSLDLCQPCQERRAKGVHSLRGVEPASSA